MKTMLLLMPAIATLCVFGSFEASNTRHECEVKNFYEAAEPAKSGTKVVTQGGDISDAELILTPTSLDEGTYNVTITRKSDNFYKVETPTNYKFKYGKFYIETRNCYEYASQKDAVLVVETNYGTVKGKLRFDLKD
jgi:hypothetical protein